jgi:hypothetical protein
MPKNHAIDPVSSVDVFWLVLVVEVFVVVTLASGTHFEHFAFPVSHV